jgi:hypothetical protein
LLAALAVSGVITFSWYRIVFTIPEKLDAILKELQRQRGGHAR